MEPNKKNKILIVDDDSFLLDMYSMKFSQNGFEVQSAISGVQALKKMEDGFGPDIILLDIIMPVMDGFEFMEKIKNQNLSPNSIKIVLSNRGQQADIDRGKELGASGYIVKANTTPSEVIVQVVDIAKNASV